MKNLPKVNCHKSLKAFTLIELLVVIGILTVLLAIVLIAINPARQFAQANNTQRRSDVNAILNAIHQYAADSKGILPPEITTTPTNVGSTGANLCSRLVATYLADLPLDPTTGSKSGATCASGSYSTGYNASKSATNNRVTVSATAESEGGSTPTISVVR